LSLAEFVAFLEEIFTERVLGGRGRATSIVPC
jgi:hypothetical protein